MPAGPMLPSRRRGTIRRLGPDGVLCRVHVSNIPYVSSRPSLVAYILWARPPLVLHPLGNNLVFVISGGMLSRVVSVPMGTFSAVSVPK